MRKILGATLVLWLCGLAAAFSADYSLTDGTTVSGEIVSADNNGVILKTGQDTYSDKLPWLKFSQNGLKELTQNVKARPFAEPFIEPSPSENHKPVQVNDVSRLANPPAGSLLGGLFSSSVGLIAILLIYTANIFAGYEISAFRARPPGIGIALAAAVPFLGPIILLCMPPPPRTVEPTAEEAAATAAAAAEVEPHRFAVPSAGRLAPAPAPASAAAPPQENIQIIASGFSGAPPPKDESSNTEIFQRGQFMFNRRFFETKFSGFFGIARSEADRGKVVIVKTPGAFLTIERISRISANDVHFEVLQGGERQEIMVPFADIQQVQLKSKA